jgi:diguanylate cyclase (GGDEF)-like protein
LRRLIDWFVESQPAAASDRAVVEERYWSLRRQVPIIYLLGLVNLSAMEVAATGRLVVGLNLPSFIALCGVIRLWNWFGSATHPTHDMMVRRMRQTVWFATIVCLAVCARCVYLFHVGDAASHMAVLLFGGLTAIGVAYGLTALPVAGRIPLILIIVPISIAALLSNEPHFAGAAFGLVAVAALTMRLLTSHARHFSDVVASRSVIEREQQLVEHAHQEAVVAATTDFLTGLPNRRAFVAALDMAAAAKGAKGSFTVAIMDLDRFKAVNDTFGHAVGDKLLREVAERLVRIVGNLGLVARLGGDEFGVLLSDVRRDRDVQAIGAEILAGVNGPVVIHGRQLSVSACCGLAVARAGDDRSPSRLMADADLALYQAKESPGAAFAVFELRMEAPQRRRLQIEQALQDPSVRDHLHIVFQPIFDLFSGEVIAREALARWTDPELGPVPPSEFVPIAEQLNLIDELNNHLMAMAFDDVRTWPDHIKISFNLSAIQLCSSTTAKAVLKALKKAHLAPDRLQVEVTETALLADFERAGENLAELRRAGATIVLDDFGAGYASIGYLRELRFDQIKLDGGLVTAAQYSEDGKRLLRAVIGLCDALGVSSIAEHVESEELLRLVMELGCTAAQGYWLRPPMAPEELPTSNNLKSLALHGRPQRRAA